MSTKAEVQESTSIVQDAPESVPTIEELQKQLAAANEWRVAVINAAWEQAEARNHCGDFDAIMVKCGLPKRNKSLHARWVVYFPVLPPKGTTSDLYAWAGTDEGKAAFLTALRDTCQKALDNGNDFSVFRQQPSMYDTHSFVDPISVEDIYNAPMRLASNGKPIITRLKRG